MHSASVKLSNDASRIMMEKFELDLIFDILRKLSTRYTETQCLIQAIIISLQYFCRDVSESIKERASEKSIFGGSGSSSERISFDSYDDWSEVLVYHPKSYLRLTACLDFVLSKGRLPKCDESRTFSSPCHDKRKNSENNEGLTSSANIIDEPEAFLDFPLHSTFPADIQTEAHDSFQIGYLWDYEFENILLGDAV